MKIKPEFSFCFVTAIIIFLFFSHTLNYPWKHFDEHIIYGEIVYPIAVSFSQIADYISYFGLNNHFEASNPFYSEISNLRSDPINTLITLFVYFFLKKDAFYYHLLSLLLHIFSSILLFLILNKISSDYIKNSSKYLRLILVSVLTLIWSLNPLNIESVLFTANWAAVLTYCLCTFLIYYFTCYESKNYLFYFIFTFLLFLIPLFNSEYSITLPAILFFYTYANHRFKTPSSTFRESLFLAIKKTAPLFLGFILFVLHFLFSPTKENIISTTSASLTLNLQRIFWLSPQIFFHYIKLIFFPLHLSVDQTIMVRFSKTLFGYYAAFCSLFMYSLILILFLSLVNIKRTLFYFLFTSFSYFLIALFPFLHIISPAYCIASERYLYFPLLMLIFGLAHLFFYLLSSLNLIFSRRLLVSILAIIALTLSTRAYLRTQDWKDSISLFSSSIKETKNDLFKALRFQFLGTILSETAKDLTSKNSSLKYINDSITILQNYMNTLEVEKETYEDTLPNILVSYGLDPTTLQAKAAYLLSFTRMSLFNDPDGAYNLLEPYMRDYSILDTQILDLYLSLLFRKNELDKAEKILKHALKRRLSPTVLIALSELYKLKYDDIEKSEYYLKKSFEYFPYDRQTLYYLKMFYMYTKNIKEFALFSYLHGLRTHSAESLNDSYIVYNHLEDKRMANKALENLKLLQREK
ncbi:MAG: hypothetical protein A3B68_06065 [Candidatus Melainabacteria bacterium RIFCSPHIGHO2_02_FULL_34_12]|nr:MAG: hypothetical protein A3B68_06065 [Candidatus Melainabacteria bacterium RIFCSPHIGHO2_02_FULL_34_12]